MTSIFYAIGDASEALFKVLPAFLKPMDIFFMLSGTVLAIGWIWYLIKEKDKETGFNPTTEELNAH